MPEVWKPHLALLLATLASLAGTICIRLASDQNTLWLAILGSSLWSISAAVFIVAASFKNVELSVASEIMSSGGILSITLIGIFYWGETASDPRKLIAIALIIVAIGLLASTSTKS